MPDQKRRRTNKMCKIKIEAESMDKQQSAFISKVERQSRKPREDLRCDISEKKRIFQGRYKRRFG